MTTKAPVAIVTAAGRGIGAAIARELHSRGYRLALLSPSGCQTLARELGALARAGSITEESDVESLVADTIARYGRLDAVVANTGRYAQVLAAHGVESWPAPPAARLGFDAGFKPDIFAIPFQAWHDAFDLMVLGAVKLAKAATPHLVACGGGAIVNISGMESLEPRLAYPLGPVRAALQGFTKLYADRYGSENIRMNCLLPGMMENAASAADSGLIAAVPLQRLGRLQEIAKTAAFLLSAEAAYITGQALLADGGLNRAV